MDLIIGKKDVVKTCAADWNLKWAPAILHFSDTLTGKAATVYRNNQATYKGEINFPTHIIS